MASTVLLRDDSSAYKNIGIGPSSHLDAPQSKLGTMEILFGLHPVEEALRSGTRKFDHICIARERQDVRLEKLIQACRDAGVKLRLDTRDQLTKLARSEAHQGVVAIVRARQFLDLDDLLKGTKQDRLLLALDGVEDPQNLGALLRTAEGAGVDGVVVTERRSAPLSPVAVKASAGAAEHVKIARVVNLVRTLEELKQRDLWIIGLDERGTMDYDQFDFSVGCVLVLGREGAGLHDLVRRTCDHLLRIPMAGRVASLNVSAAGAVVLYEAARQRRNAVARRQLRALTGAGEKAEGFGFMKYLWFAAVAAVLASCAGAQQASPPAAVPSEVPAEHPGTVILSRSVDKAATPAKPSAAPAGAPATDAERQAITFLTYDLDVHLQPREHAMAVRARILLRNDSGSPLNRLALQISSSLAMDQRPRSRCAGYFLPATGQLAILTIPGRCGRR